MIRGLIIAALIVTAYAGEIEFDECGDGSNPPTSFEVADCDSSPCEVVKENTYEFTFNFDSPVDADDLSVSIKAKVFGVWIPWPGAPTQICGQGIDCPLVSGSSYTYKSSMTIPSIAPSISTTIEFTLANSKTSEVAFCNRFGIRVA